VVGGGVLENDSTHVLRNGINILLVESHELLTHQLQIVGVLDHGGVSHVKSLIEVDEAFSQHFQILAISETV
jgi:hypothetical protein